MIVDQHIISLSERYQLTVGDRGFVLYTIERDGKGTFKRSGGKFCTTFEGVVEALERRELSNEEVNSLQDIKKVLESIAAELRELKALCNTAC